MKLALMKHNDGLVACDELGDDVLAKIRHNDVVVIDIRKSRNPRFARLYWALIYKVWQNVPDPNPWPTHQKLSEALLILSGRFREWRLPDGRVAVEADSIAFENCDEITFRSIWDDVVGLICTQVLPGMDDRVLTEEIFSMLGDRV